MNYLRIRNILTGIFFILAGVALYLNPQSGVAEVIARKYPIEFISLAFVLCGIIIGLTARSVNQALYAPYYTYVFATYVTVTTKPVTPVVLVFYTLLAVFFALDV